MANMITLTFYRGNNNLSLLQPLSMLPPPPPPPSILLVEEEEKGKKEPEKGMKEEEEAKIAKTTNKRNPENEENPNKNAILKESVKSLKKSFFSFLSLDENFELDQDLPQPQKKIHTEPSSLPPTSSTHHTSPPTSHVPPSPLPLPPSLPPPPFMGLPNLGNTCFINSVVQAICNLSQVKEYFRTEEPEFCSLAKNMQEFLNQGRKDSLIKKLKSCFPKFFDGRQHDAHEFFVVFLEKLNQELKKEHKDNHEPPLELDEEQKFWLNHSKTLSPLLSSFTGIFNHTLRCPECSSCSSSFEPFTSLLLALPPPAPKLPFIVLLPLSLTGTPMKIMDWFRFLEGKVVLEKNENKREKNESQSKNEMSNNKFDFLRNTMDIVDHEEKVNKFGRSSSETVTRQKNYNNLEQFMPHLENLIKCDLGLIPKENLLKFAIWKEGDKLILDEDGCKKEEVLTGSSMILILERPKREIHNRVTIPIVLSIKDEQLSLSEYEKTILPIFKDFESKITISNLFFEVQKDIINLLTIHISQTRKENNIVKSDLGFLLTDIFQLKIRACPLKSDFEVNYCVQCGREGDEGCECFKVGKLTPFNLSKTIKEIYKNKQMLFCKIQFLFEKLSYREKSEMKNFRRPRKIQVSQDPPTFVGCSFFSSFDEANKLNEHEAIPSSYTYALKANNDIMPYNVNTLNLNNGISSNNPTYTSKPYDGTMMVEKLIENFFEEEILKEENKWVCEKCSRGVEGIKKVRIARKGKVLVVGIGRFGEGKRKRNKMVRFPLENLILHGVRYRLSSTVCHLGELSDGHYYNYCRDKDSWFKIDDECIFDNQKKEDVINKESYLLFYEEI